MCVCARCVLRFVFKCASVGVTACVVCMYVCMCVCVFLSLITREMLEADVGKQSSKLGAAVARSTVLDGARQGPDRARRRSPAFPMLRKTARCSLQSLQDRWHRTTRSWRRRRVFRVNPCLPLSQNGAGLVPKVVSMSWVRHKKTPVV